jgi:hypothetical protein
MTSGGFFFKMRPIGRCARLAIGLDEISVNGVPFPLTPFPGKIGRKGNKLQIISNPITPNTVFLTEWIDFSGIFPTRITVWKLLFSTLVH